jgi:hypothetical protein
MTANRYPFKRFDYIAGGDQVAVYLEMKHGAGTREVRVEIPVAELLTLAKVLDVERADRADRFHGYFDFDEAHRELLFPQRTVVDVELGRDLRIVFSEADGAAWRARVQEGEDLVQAAGAVALAGPKP